LPLAFSGRRSGIQVTHLRLRPSQLFPGKEFLVGICDDKAFSIGEPESDAFATSFDVGLPLRCGPLPMAVVPKRLARSKSLRSRSVLEHEFVHLAQSIAGHFPAPPGSKNIEAALDYFGGKARIEYEANLVQNVRWPQMFPKEHGISMRHWCVVRGYSQALECTFDAMLEQRYSTRQVVQFLELFAAGLPDLFDKAGFEIGLLPWFERNLDAHLCTAFGQVAKHGPTPAPIRESGAFKGLIQWRQNRGRECASRNGTINR
jgi:hypothetical protein